MRSLRQAGVGAHGQRLSGVALNELETGRDLTQVTTCWGSELQEWKSAPVVHAGPRVRPPYKGIAEAEDCRTSPAHAHIYVGVCGYMCACVWEEKGRG